MNEQTVVTRRRKCLLLSVARSFGGFGQKKPTNETSCHPDRLERVPASTLLTECRWGISEAHCSLFDGRPPHCGREGPDLLPYVRAPAHSCSVSRGVSCGMSA